MDTISKVRTKRDKEVELLVEVLYLEKVPVVMGTFYFLFSSVAYRLKRFLANIVGQVAYSFKKPRGLLYARTHHRSVNKTLEGRILQKPNGTVFGHKDNWTYLESWL